MTPLNSVIDKLNRFGNGSAPVPVGDLIDIRHELTANITHNLYGDGDRNEGRAALAVRARVDEIFFHVKPLNTAGWQDAMELGRRTVILVTFVELIEILDRAREAGRGTRKGIKAEMGKLRNDPDRLDRFHDRDKAAIRQMATGLAILAKMRFDRLHESLRARAAEFTNPHPLTTVK
jgi:hypothetical protein